MSFWRGELLKVLARLKDIESQLPGFQPSIHSSAAKTTPVNSDEFGLADSADSFSAKKVTWANIKATLAAAANTWSAVQTFSAIPVVSGGAISFPATQVPSAGANDLDDYEEGTWTPTITAGSGSFTTVSASGSYTKIGRLVSISVSITETAIGTAASPIRFSLPFTSGSNAVLAGRENSIGGKMLQALITGGGTTASVFNYDNSSAIANGNSLVISGGYWV